MKNTLYLFALLGIFFGCKDNEMTPPSENEVCEIVNTNGTVLKETISKFESTSDASRKFLYNSARQIDSIADLHPQALSRKYLYTSGKLDEILKIRNDDS